MKGSGRSSRVAKSLVRRMNEAVNGNDLDAIDTVVRLGYRIGFRVTPSRWESSQGSNREFYIAFPDVNSESGLVAEGDMVVAFSQVHGTPHGEPWGGRRTGSRSR